MRPRLPRSTDHLPSFAGATQWLNTEPLVPTDLRGNVVLVGFWTYTCINWLRQLPYLRAWAEKYADDGLVVIGVHTPEFPFEREIENVRRETETRNIEYPVAIDSNYAVWDAFANRYWPALYFADADGAIRHDHFGEGAYEQSERVIQELLVEAGGADVDHDLVAVNAGGAEAPADWDSLRSAETYVGYDRADNFASPEGAVVNERRAYSTPARLPLNRWALSGEWTIRRGAAALEEAGGGIAFRFHSRDVHLVMGPAHHEPVRFRVLVDGEAPRASHGVDTDENGDGIASEQRLHQLVRQQGRIDDHTLTVSFVDPGVEVYAFTFG